MTVPFTPRGGSDFCATHKISSPGEAYEPARNFVKYKNERWWHAWMNWIRSIFMNMNMRMTMTMRIRTSMTMQTATSTCTTMKTRNMFRTGWQEPPDICSTSARWWTAEKTAQTF